ncbi:MAG: L,D-transpeptidase family protein, partial [Bacteroidetes bacterium]|nr:L,D-transpeptidase family protein [Bacteroidota bacterium]
GLNTDGVVGKGTVEAMNVPLEYRVEQLRLNLARWHWLPRDWGERHIWVNVAEGRLRIYEHGKMTRTMRVIVGRKKRTTPFISSAVTHLVFNPPWNVPGKMIEEDILPQIRRNPAYLASMRMQLVDELGQPVLLDSASLAGYSDKDFPYQVRQDPGWGNSLGRVLFMFPNNWSVYLHDTPDRWLFHAEMRALSSGCIRLEHPMDLADYLLRDLKDWSPEKRQKLMDEKEESTGKLKQSRVNLPKPLPVHLYYHTARGDEQGNAWFFDDPYERDEKRLKVLWARHPRTRW